MTNQNPFTVGQQLIVKLPEVASLESDLTAPYGIPFGTRAKVVAVLGAKHVDVSLEPNASGKTSWKGVHNAWFDVDADVSAPTEDLARPTVDLSTPSRQTAREYAADINSRKRLDATHYAVLEDAAHGYVVDAYALNAALTAALRAGLGRYKNASQREEFSRKVGHLAHITQAVLENHADRLPAYAEGQRSRAVKEAKVALAEAREEVDAVVAALESRKREVAELRAELESVLEIAGKRDELLAETVAERDELQVSIDAVATSLDYALGLLAAENAPGAWQLLGFMDAHGVELLDNA